MYRKQDLNRGIDTDVEDTKLNKTLYKAVLHYLRIIPMLLALCDFLNSLFCLIGLPLDIFSFIGGISFLTLIFLYLVSYVFRFCIYHRMFLHYILVNNILNIIDYYILVPEKIVFPLTIFLLNSCLFLFLILYFYRKEKCCN